jgi:hypothetical protein
VGGLEQVRDTVVLAAQRYVGPYRRDEMGAHQPRKRAQG